MKITVTHDDGTTQDITRLVQIAYDVATHSMDWGSGFLDIEETDGLILLSEACRFPDCEEKIAEVWRDRITAMPAGLTHTVEERQSFEEYLRQTRIDRGVQYTHQLTSRHPKNGPHSSPRPARDWSPNDHPRPPRPSPRTHPSHRRGGTTTTQRGGERVSRYTWATFCRVCRTVRLRDAHVMCCGARGVDQHDTEVVTVLNVPVRRNGTVR